MNDLRIIKLADGYLVNTSFVDKDENGKLKCDCFEFNKNKSCIHIDTIKNHEE